MDYCRLPAFMDMRQRASLLRLDPGSHALSRVIRSLLFTISRVGVAFIATDVCMRSVLRIRRLGSLLVSNPPAEVLPSMSASWIGLSRAVLRQYQITFH